MVNNPVRKNKVNLEDYAHREDIAARLFLSELTIFDVEVLQEVLDNSLIYPLEDLASTLDHELSTLLPALDRLKEIKLITYDEQMISLDKDLRKYFEVQIERFSQSQDNIPGFDFILTVLKRLPIQVLPDWYSIPRATNDIFQSIVDQYLSTPRIYELYLADLLFCDPIAHKIMRDVFEAPEDNIGVATLQSKYQLNREYLEELLLQLELSFVCCLSYQENGVGYDPVVTLFREWRDYLRFQRNSAPNAISLANEIQWRDTEFAFVKDMTAVLKVADQAPLAVSESSHGYFVEESILLAWIPQLHQAVPNLKHYSENLVDRLLLLELCEVKQKRLCPCSSSRDWYRKTPQDQAIVLYRLPWDELNVPAPASERFLRDMERTLKRVMGKGWIEFDEFVRGLTIPIGTAQPVTLKQTGKRWRYELPQYTAEEVAVIRWTLFDRLFESGMIAIGQHKGKDCFQVTAFGQLALGD